MNPPRTSIKQFTLHLVRSPNGRPPEFVYPYVFRGFFLDMIKDVDPALAAALHDEQGIKPYSIQYAFKQFEIELTINLFTHGIARPLYNYLVGLQDMSISLGKTTYTMFRVGMKEIGYRDLLEHSHPVRACRVQFLSPTYFNSDTHSFNIKLPLPGLVFKNLAQMWNEFTAHQVDVDVPRFIDWVTKSVEISSFDMRTVPVTLGKGRSISGMQGWLKYRLGDSIEGFERWVDCLLDLARYTNVGGNRTAGMGMIRYLPSTDPQPRFEHVVRDESLKDRHDEPVPSINDD